MYITATVLKIESVLKLQNVTACFPFFFKPLEAEAEKGLCSLKTVT